MIRRALLAKLKEALLSVLPVTAIVLLISLTPLVSFSVQEIIIFTASALLMIVGIGLFNLGADLAMTPMGEHVGEGLTKSKRIGILLLGSLVMVILITIADRSGRAGQRSNPSKGSDCLGWYRCRALSADSRTENCAEIRFECTAFFLLYDTFHAGSSINGAWETGALAAFV